MSINQKSFDKVRDAASYNAYARSYDNYIQKLSAPLAEHICKLAQLKPGDRVLDIGTGSGVAARLAARVVAPNGTVMGIDLSVGMIETAKKSVAEWEGGNPPEFRVMDAEDLDLPDASFDALACLCAVRHFPDIARSLTEMRRVLKPGGRLVVSFGYGRPVAPVSLGLHVTKRILGKILNPVRPQIVGPGFLTHLAYRLLPTPKQVVDTEWGEHGNPRAELVQRVRETGFERVKPSWWGHQLIFDSVEEFWEAQTSIVTKVRKRLIEAPPEAVEQVKQIFFKKADNVLTRGGQLIYPYGAFYVVAMKPK